MRALILSGYGLNCEEETLYAFGRAGGQGDIVHINDLIDAPEMLDDYQVLAVPGGFSYGDHTGAGLAMANKIRNHLWDELLAFVEKDRLVLGICNGFQVLANLGLVPALDGEYGARQVALINNDTPRYVDRWVDLKFSDTLWTRGIRAISLPIAHGEGKFYAQEDMLREVELKGRVACRYVDGSICNYQSLNANPNGSLNDIAGITDGSGRILGMMPHPERAIDFTQLPDWPLQKELLQRAGKPLVEDGPGLMIFKNAVMYFG